MIRRGREEDLAQIEAIEQAAFKYPYSGGYLRYLLHSCPEGFLVAEAGGRVVGYISAQQQNGAWLIASIAVKTPHRRQGLGRRLLERILGMAREQVYLQVEVGNEAAFAIYRRLGFRVVKVLRGYYPGGEDAFLMMWEPAADRM